MASEAIGKRSGIHLRHRGTNLLKCFHSNIKRSQTPTGYSTWVRIVNIITKGNDGIGLLLLGKTICINP